VDEYFATYCAFDALQGDLPAPITIIAAANDPVIPVRDFYDLPSHPLLKVQIHPTGGHCGFMDVLPMRHHMPQMVLEEVTGEPYVVQSRPWNGRESKVPSQGLDSAHGAGAGKNGSGRS
jgi:predicted alpha/beta-fold hydrolase